MSGASVAVSGPTELGLKGKAMVRDRCSRLVGYEHYRTGAAHGTDSIAGLTFIECFPDARHSVYVPDAWHNQEVVAELEARGAEVIRVPGGPSISATYMARNERMTGAGLEELVAFPPTLEEQLRSGTWATVRRARKQDCSVTLHPLAEQQIRVVHCMREEYDVYIGRGAGPHVERESCGLGNPFSHRRSKLAGVTRVGSRQEAIGCFRAWLWDQIRSGRIPLEQLAALYGKALGCWCAPEACHGHVLANAAAWAVGSGRVSARYLEGFKLNS